jgi:hypothetical protein
LVIGVLAVAGAIVVAAVLMPFSGPIDDNTPTITLSQPTLEGNQTVTTVVSGVSRNDVRFSPSRVIVMMPNSTAITWSLTSATWIGDETSYHDAALGYTITLKDVSQANQYFGPGDQITLQSDAQFLSGHWMIALVYLPTGGMMGSTGFEAP